MHRMSSEDACYSSQTADFLNPHSGVFVGIALVWWHEKASVGWPETRNLAFCSKHNLCRRAKQKFWYYLGLLILLCCFWKLFKVCLILPCLSKWKFSFNMPVDLCLTVGRKCLTWFLFVCLFVLLLFFSSCMIYFSNWVILRAALVHSELSWSRKSFGFLSPTDG